MWNWLTSLLLIGNLGLEFYLSNDWWSWNLSMPSKKCIILEIFVLINLSNVLLFIVLPWNLDFYFNRCNSRIFQVRILIFKQNLIVFFFCQNGNVFGWRGNIIKTNFGFWGGLRLIWITWNASLPSCSWSLSKIVASLELLGILCTTKSKNVALLNKSIASLLLLGKKRCFRFCEFEIVFTLRIKRVESKHWLVAGTFFS